MATVQYCGERRASMPLADGDRKECSTMDMKLEVVVIPVSDVDRARDFYTSLDWRLDADVSGEGDFRLVQLTPPGSPCSIHLGSGLTSAAPGSARTTHLVVTDVQAARDELAGRGIGVSPVFHCETGFACRYGDDDAPGRAPGPAPDQKTYASFATFADPDGNSWVLQEITTRLPGR
jgi:catechol 2,3-dioxygenase-like lactoylglutathione lyase family enzyme